MAPLRDTILRTEALLQLDPKESTDRWHALFLDAGLLSTLPETLAPDSPLAAMAAARERLVGLQRLERELVEARAPVGGFGNHAPTWAWAVLPAIFLSGWKLSTCVQAEEDQILAIGSSFWAAGILAVLSLGVVLHYELQARKRRRLRVAALEARIAPLAKGLGPAARAVLVRSFAARAGSRLLISAPHLAWLRAAAAAARRATGAQRDPDPELTRLIADLDAELERREAAVQALRREPPADWTDSGLIAPLDPFRERLDRLEVQPPPICIALEEAWAATG
jgi:hypothetical protein